ncbi:hypothetical protein HL658_27520 [Azospirillum sp. RWY-5-1]|uniref:Uncharacterized protein n=1 Tax=Azospirillum oleiclasticum TaxID=2735135 RepID=A0ABX2TM27_9PROT|nr:hypothetical protein [Azospirillum oleiclasticum]NYZ16308.1 hypothetical protein [Azospirillum oleiclasticum]NYZ23795.1 hypothetical protein [Azospirillum oleiclasticum]
MTATTAAGPSYAQDPTGMPAGAAARMNEAEARAMQHVGRSGGSLLPRDTVNPCSTDGTTRIGAPAHRRPGQLPNSLIEEMEEVQPNTTVVIGDVIVVCPQ